MARTTKLPALFVALALAGCGEDPAANVPKAGVEPSKGAAAANPAPAAPTTSTAGPSEAKPGPKETATDVAAVPGTLAITPESAKVEFIGSKKIGGAHNGGFKGVRGVAALVPGKPEVASIRVDIDTTSIYSDDPKLTGHLKNKDFFEVDKYPDARFVTTAIKPGGEKGASHTLVGNLTLHGVTKSIEIPATIKVEGDAATIKSEFSLNRADFGMTYGSPAVRELVVIKLDVKAVKKA